MKQLYRYLLAEMFCRRCARLHLMAFEMLPSGKFTKDSPPLDGCYACQLAGMTPDERVAAQFQFAKIWRCSTTEPLPEELQL